MRCAVIALVLAGACKRPPDVTCADATRRLDEIYYAGKTDPATLRSHARVCDEEAWDARLRACLAHASTRADLERCAPDTDDTPPLLRAMMLAR